MVICVSCGAGEVHQPRNLSLPADTYQRAAEAIRRSNDFTLLATIRQEESNIGTIMSFAGDQSTSRYIFCELLYFVV